MSGRLSTCDTGLQPVPNTPLGLKAHITAMLLCFFVSTRLILAADEPAQTIQLPASVEAFEASDQ